MNPDTPLWLPVLQLGLIVAVLASDCRQLRRPIAPEEAIWRKRRIVVTAIALAALGAAYALLYTGGRSTATAVCLTVAGLALFGMVACSWALKSVVLRRPREG